MKGIILDGVAAAGKSTILQFLQSRITQEKSGSTKIFISEHYTQRVLEDKLHSGQLDATILAQHIDTLIRGLGEYQAMLQNSKFAPNPSRAEAYTTIERFLLTYFATRPNMLEAYTIDRARSQFKQIASFGISHYLVVLSPERIRSNITKTLTHRNEHWAAHIESKGGLEKAVEEYIGWQGLLLGFAKSFEDEIKTEMIDLGNQSYEEIAHQIYEKEYR